MNTTYVYISLNADQVMPLIAGLVFTLVHFNQTTHILLQQFVYQTMLSLVSQAIFTSVGLLNMKMGMGHRNVRK